MIYILFFFIKVLKIPKKEFNRPNFKQKEFQFSFQQVKII